MALQFISLKRDLGLPEPGPLYRELYGWARLLHTPSSGLWIFRGALQDEQVLPALSDGFDWAARGTYRTASAVQPCRRGPYSYGGGHAGGPQTEERSWELLQGLWRAVAPLMGPWCSDRQVPSSAKINLYRGTGSRVRWHRDDECLFGDKGVPKLIVQMSFGASALFTWKPGSSPDSAARSS